MWRRRQSIVVIAALFLVPAAARAQQIVGPRSAGMGDAERGVGTSNDTLFLNPAGMSIYPRYSMELFWRRTTFDDGNVFSLSIVDSKSGPVAGGMAYTYEHFGPGGSVRAGSRIDMSSSYAVAPYILLGMTLRYVGLSTKDGGVSRVTGDTGVMIILSDWLFIGITAHNVVNPVKKTNALPRTFGGGIGIRLFGSSLQLAFDYQKSAELPKSPNSYFMGAEYFFGGAFAARAGYVSDEIQKQQRWSLGLGYVSPQFGIDLAYSRTTSGKKGDVFSAGVRLFF